MKNLIAIAKAVIKNGKQIHDPHGGPTITYKRWTYVSCCHTLYYWVKESGVCFIIPEDLQINELTGKFPIQI